MADGLDWSLLANATAKPLDPVTALYYGTQQRVQQQTLKDKEAVQAAQSAAQAQAAQDYASGNQTAAQADLIRAGAWDGLTGVNASQKQAYDQANTNLQNLGGVVHAVSQLPYSQRGAAIQSLKPFLSTVPGFSPEGIDAFDPTDDNIAALSNYGYSAKDQDAQGTAAQNAITGRMNAQVAQQNANYNDTKPIELDPTKNVYAPNVSVTGATAPGASAPVAGGPSGADSSLAARNNNPGNLRWDGHSQWQGMTGVDPRGFVMFDTPQNGQRALSIDIANQQRLHGINTVAGLITKFAPSSDNNDPTAYAQRVASALGVGINDPIDLTNPTVQAKLSQAIGSVEAGGTPSKFASSAPFSINGWQMVQAGVPKADKDAVAPNDPAVELAARQYAITGDMPSLGMGNGPMRKAILDRAAQIVQENHWSPAQIAANKADYKASTSALSNDQKQYDIIQSAEQTAINNGQRFIQLSAEAPGNTSSSWYNGARNYIGQKFGDTRVTDMNAAYQTFINEYTRVVSSTPNGSGQLTDSARHEAMNTLENSASIDQKRSAFQVLQADMDARRQAQQAQIDNRTQHIAHLGDPAGGKAIPVAQPAATSGPAHVSSAADYHALPSGTVYIDPTGHVRRKP